MYTEDATPMGYAQAWDYGNG